MSPAIITLLILLATIILFVSDKLPMGLVAFMVPIALYFAGVIEVGDIFSSVVNYNVILIIAMCVVGAAFFKTGLAYNTGNLLLKYAKTEKSLMVVVFMVAGIMSGFVSNSATVAILIPIVMGVAVSGNIKPIKLLMPLVFGATIGADISIIGSPGNLVAKSTIAEALGADPRAVVIAIFIASSIAVCTPLAIPANSMILEPGNVKFKDFLKPGIVVSAVCFVVSMVLLPIFYPFY